MNTRIGILQSFLPKYHQFLKWNEFTIKPDKNSPKLTLCSENDEAYAEDTAQRSPVVRTKYGHVQGRLATMDNKLKPVFVFKGLPYATPPVGSNR